ncbi:MAG: radical SAM protein [Acidobacteriota bacterium]|nr:radical SAM protein [Acidobacteriota bacterium]
MRSTAAQRSLFVEAEPPVRAAPRRWGAATIEYAEVRDILTRATGFMDAYDFTLNPYAGCAFACTYCYAAFFSHSTEKRDSWGRWVRVKKNAVERLAHRRGSLDGKRIYMSSVTDPYQPIERKLGLTRKLLEMLAAKHRPKLVVQTRSPDVLRDVDLFRALVANGGFVQVNMTVTTDDEDVRREFEPACPGNAKRLEAARGLVAAGVDTCVTMTPLLLVRNSEAFAEDLRKTGATDFIVQPFHFQRGKFVAGTRDAALGLMAEKLSTGPEEFRKRYLEHYGEVRDLLLRRLPRLGEGKHGFRPPF